ncbi:MAG: ABC transporter ATP-binding protein [Blastocatellia bacterium]|nr:ABC transporter ATP-binding protein [Blastocatellia bacterium]MCS7157289.1 ABC transporter ATP-binding protein [Blastocatellia bacterium]MCX7752034.1 ABC transporter ATP-binding protein [Blastocatellia bacterium]MDW8167139.1 ABC transporter ATP-binding protein [Acidobacteriota bacterium]MDW8257538.1 ABC transporter ATP-binding protein [Acidobacteriota bacterium]
MDAPWLVLERISKTYGEGASTVVAVREVSLELGGGRFILLMGPSGSGKTTLLMLMGCLLKPTQGRLFLFEHEVSALDERTLPFLRRRYTGFVFQTFNLFPALTALENVELALNLKGINGRMARQRAVELLARVGLSDRLHFLPRDLSGGEKQRVALARALAGDPPIILADEPTGMLDSRTGRQIVEILADLARNEGRLVFMVTHDQRVRDLADEVLYMEDGSIVARESVDSQREVTHLGERR